MLLPHARPLCLVLALSLMVGCGGEDPPAPEPTVVVTFSGPTQVYCTTTPLVLQANVLEGTPDSVKLLKNGAPVADLSEPYQYSFDCSNEAERSYEFIVEATLQGETFRSPAKTVVVDRTRPIVTGPFTNGDTNVRKDAIIRLTFSEPMRTTPVTAASLSLTDSSRVTLNWSQDQKTLTVTPEAPITPPKTLTLSLRASDFQDQAGNALSGSAPTQWQWTVPTFLTEWATPKQGDGATDRAAFALDRSGRPVIAWPALTSATGVTDLYVARSDTSSTTPLGGALRAQPSQTTSVSEVSVAVDNSNRPVVAWLEPVSDEEQVFVRRWNGSSWDELGPVPNPIANSDASGLVLATGDSDEPVVAWQETDTSSVSRVYVYRWNGTAWAAVGAPLEGRAGASAHSPSLAIDKQNRPWVAISESSSDPTFLTAVVVRIWTGTNWGQYNVGLRPNDVPTNATVGRSSLVVNAQGEPACIFELVTSGQTISTYDLYIARSVNNGWATPAYVTGANLIRPSLAYDAQGVLWATWENISSSIPRKIFLERMDLPLESHTLENVSQPVFATGGVGAPALLVLDPASKEARVVRHQ
ncbi:Ig-like domain-containing protein [Hyalangium minutum]|uniref:SbsA Ig-like domain-containing protein n=1 Tax=Hyalangium minutum TaxID=394096 RepID=A0A085WEG9_9BACT|nr:Ig-like domain-containing protein [Hyalangium minutum]KFE66082.1 hypothetical protein DB31_1147 [Hyalangium minutum]